MVLVEYTFALDGSAMPVAAEKFGSDLLLKNISVFFLLSSRAFSQKANSLGFRSNCSCKMPFFVFASLIHISVKNCRWE